MLWFFFQAALKASQDKRNSIDLRTLEWAKDKILMGAERKSSLMTQKDRKLTAYHEVCL
jgi:ATP-dependent metalloprotease